MLDLLQALQSKPESSRRKILTSASLVFTGIIFLVWIATFSVPSFTPEGSLFQKEDTQTSGAERIWGDIKRGISEIKVGVVELFN